MSELPEKAYGWSEVVKVIRPHMNSLRDQMKSLQSQMDSLQGGTLTNEEESGFNELKKQHDSLTKQYGALKSTIDSMQTIGLERIMIRAELEVSDISFANVVNILKKQNEDKEFFILGKSLEFISKQTVMLVDGLKHGIQFKLSLVDPTPEPWDTEYITFFKEKARASIEKIRKLVADPDPSWTGTIELRKTRNLVENSFSSFVFEGKRISVMDFDLGEDLHLQCSEVFIHKKDERNFAAYLYTFNVDKYKMANFVLAHPLSHKTVYVCGIKGKKTIFVRKKGNKTWELPGGKMIQGELPEETARREFLEETGYSLDIIKSIDINDVDSVVFVGKVGKIVSDKIDTQEIDEFKLINELPDRSMLTYPNTDYNCILRKAIEYSK